MHLRVDGAGEDEGVTEVVAFACGGGRAIADRGDPVARNRHMATLDNAVGQHQRADENRIEISHLATLGRGGAATVARGKPALERRKRIIDQYRHHRDDQAAFEHPGGIVVEEAGNDHLPEGVRRHG